MDFPALRARAHMSAPVVLRICCYDTEGQCRALCGKHVGVVVLLNRKGYDSFSMSPRLNEKMGNIKRDYHMIFKLIII